ncbi:MAG: LuxR family transcriptional regulator [Rhodospirillales bacterium 20-60-12]|nr:MAG: LuxR family transcriptional regulator [Rhodospirillales bacterium 20-60-12]
MLIDSHCHLDYFTAAEQTDIIARAHAAGVAKMVTIGTSLTQSHNAMAIAAAHENVWCTIGVHPHEAGQDGIPTPETIAGLTACAKTIGIGESGLDYFYDKAPRDAQAANFRAHIKAAQLTGLPLCIHARDADEDIAAMLRAEMAVQKFPFLLHCFSSSRALAEAALDLGGYISFSGILTFPKSLELRDIARDIPISRLLVETDSPYLAPVPFRGKRNEPAHTAHTARKLAEVRGVSPDFIATQTTANFYRLFSKALPV